jgi:MFS family permease
VTDALARDRRWLYATAFLRATTTSAIGLVLGAHLARLGLSNGELGAVTSAGLAGAATGAFVATFAADRLGRRRFLIGLTACNVIGTAVFALVSGPVGLGIAAFVGTVNGMGRDRGGALVLEQAALPATATDATRTRTIAIYTMLQDVGHGLGAAIAWAVGFASERVAAPIALHRGALLVFAALGLVAIVAYAAIGGSLELHAAPRVQLAPRSRSILIKISSLFALDGLGGGFLTATLVSYFFFATFDASEQTVAALYVGARVMNAVSHLGAAYLAKRIGLVNTMVFTHIPSSLLLVTVAFAPSLPVAAVLFLLREGLVEMDVPTRQSYVLAVVRPEERTFASGITNLVRLVAWAVAPVVAGALMTADTLFAPLVVGAVMKIAYDLLLWRAFRGIRPPEEA